ncbi:MAG: hypothetical protein EOP04_16280 [Proteobacteria bacterium]|nr:MAG: hypothetical protein EOP04_16280 [Pseudomonadota bacterium]
MLLIIIIDKALAAGDKIAAQGALESLKEVNPSAAHALECLGIGMKETSFILASEKDSRAEGLLDKDKPRVGPITGYDYSMDLELIEKGGAKDPKKFVEIGWKVVEGILVALGVKASEAGANKAGDFFANEENDKAKARQEHKEWTDCKQSGSAACDQLYPKAVEIEDRAKNGKDVFTGEPLKKDENKDGGTPTHPVNLDPLAGAGAYSGPTIGPGPSDDGTRPVEPDFLDSGEGMFGFSKMTKHDRDELSKTRDPQATENYCQQVVQDFSSVQQKRLTIKTAEDFEIGSALIGRLNGFDGGPISYDGWNDEFWSAMESKDAKNPKFQHEKKNCAVMDPVEPGL